MDAKRQVQKELFEEFSGAGKNKPQKAIISTKERKQSFIGIPPEQLVFMIMGFIIIAVLFFSLGVEKGKASQRARIQHEIKQVDVVEDQQKKIVSYAEMNSPNNNYCPTSSENEKVKSISEPNEPKIDLPVYSVQVASYRKDVDAAKSAEQLKNMNYESKIIEKGKFFVLCAGEFTEKDDADIAMRKLKKIYSDCFVRKIR